MLLFRNIHVTDELLLSLLNILKNKRLKVIFHSIASIVTSENKKNDKIDNIIKLIIPRISVFIVFIQLFNFAIWYTF